MENKLNENEVKAIADKAIIYGAENGKNTYSFYNTELDLENAYRDGATEYALTAKALEIENGILKSVLQDIVNEGYDAYDSGHHLTVQRWLKDAEVALEKINPSKG